MKIRLTEFLNYFAKIQPRRPAETILFTLDGKPMLVKTVQWTGDHSWVVNLTVPDIRAEGLVSRETD